VNKTLGKMCSSADTYSHEMLGKEDLEQRVLPVSIYLKVFVLLLILIGVNTGISQIPGLSSTASLVLCMLVSLVQTVLVATFFMELVHESKFFSFVFASSALFIVLFMAVTLFELNYRDMFVPMEGIRVMKDVDKVNRYSQDMPRPKTPTGDSQGQQHTAQP
jgi:caa(3)-type oxidase subunit IV